MEQTLYYSCCSKLSPVIVQNMLFWFKSSYNRFLCASCRIYGIYGENIFLSRNLYDSHRNVYTKNGWRKFFSNAFQLMQEFAQANRQFGLGLQPLMLYIRKQMTDAYQYKQCSLQYLCFQVGIISKTTIQICEHLDNIRPTKTFIRRRKKTTHSHTLMLNACPLGFWYQAKKTVTIVCRHRRRWPFFCSVWRFINRLFFHLKLPHYCKWHSFAKLSIQHSNKTHRSRTKGRLYHCRCAVCHANANKHQYSNWRMRTKATITFIWLTTSEPYLTKVEETYCYLT